MKKYWYYPELADRSEGAEGRGMSEAYRRYLQSQDWREKRAMKHRRHGGKRDRCAICGTPDRLDVHHLSYEKDLTTVEQKDLRILCRQCHDVAHELINSGAIRFPNRNHHSRFVITKEAVKKSLGLSGVNLFAPKGDATNTAPPVQPRRRTLTERRQ